MLSDELESLELLTVGESSLMGIDEGSADVIVCGKRTVSKLSWQFGDG